MLSRNADSTITVPFRAANMVGVSVASILTGLAIACTALAANQTCITSNYPVSYSDITVFDMPIPVPADQLALTGLLSSSFGASATLTRFGTTQISGSYNISGSLCIPEGFVNGTVLLAVHR